MSAPDPTPGGGALKTSLGPTAEHHGAIWTLDLTALPIFHGLSVLSRALGDMIIDQARSDRVDINVERAIRPRENPELLHELGVTLVKVTAERELATRLVRDPEQFQDRLRAVFGTLQRNRYRRALFPPPGADASRALVFTFGAPEGAAAAGERGSARFVLERVASGRDDGRGYLRITLEDAARPRLALVAIPHVAVEGLENRTFIAGSTRIAETWAEGLRREAERGRRAFVERRTPHSHLFRQFGKAGLGTYETVGLTWNDAFVDRILDSDPAELSHVLKRVLLALEDRDIRSLLNRREVVRIVCDDVAIYLDESQLGRVLQLSLGAPRERLDLEAFLDRMPRTRQVVGAAPAGALAGVHVFLVHHITAEVLGLIAALRRLGCRDLTTLFVAYAGEAPAGYLGPLLDLPPDEFRCLALVNVPDEESVEGRYRLSTQYSALAERAELTARLAGGRRRFFEAMQTVAAAEFLRLVSRAERSGGRCLIVEDGGYLAPALNRACLEGRRVAEFLPPAAGGAADERRLADALAGRLLGSVEHTRNGMNRLEAVARECGGLAFPAFSIAVSRLKIDVEAREVAVTLLNAVENVLHATGRILSRRRCVVLGSRGAIGGHLVRGLGERLNEPAAQLAGVDLRVDGAPATSGAESTTWAGLPDAWRLGADLVLGVTGESVLQGADLEAWLCGAGPAELVLASGSTKTEEFRDLAAWVDARLREPAPELGGRPVTITPREVKDPITGRLYGHRYRFEIAGAPGRRPRDVVFLAKMTPVNFLFYGVPTEVIDEVLAELLQSSLGLVRRAATGTLARGLAAVDRDITADGEPLA
ncbi:MAG: hypothetical protein JXQ29_13725 [Planctomycetes bacterium]|nr:hypothetical protein [Planctomycetota bacterium]